MLGHSSINGQLIPTEDTTFPSRSSNSKCTRRDVGSDSLDHRHGPICHILDQIDLVCQDTQTGVINQQPRQQRGIDGERSRDSSDPCTGGMGMVFSTSHVLSQCRLLQPNLSPVTHLALSTNPSCSFITLGCLFGVSPFVQPPVSIVRKW